MGMQSKSHYGMAALLAAAMFALSPRIRAELSVSTDPALPTYGQQVGATLRSSAYPVYVPVTRYTRSGSTFTIDYEYLVDGFGPSRPDFGFMDVPLGELVPGNYTLVARLHDIDAPQSPPTTVTASFAVVPPSDWGVYLVPQDPEAFSAVNVLVRSAAYFDPGSMRASVSGSTIRVDFSYRGDAPTGGPVPPGMTSFAAVQVAGLAPGTYRVEAWGADASTNAAPQRYFTRDFSVSATAPVVEYYSDQLDHFFMSAGPPELASLDDGSQPGWKHTGQGFKGWLRQADAPANAMPVCRFYATGPNSHFYTADAGECQWLRSLEAQQRAEASAQGKSFPGWAYEGTAFYALVPQNGACAAGTIPVYRFFNGRVAENDANHRFVVDPQLRAAMTQGWKEEGVAFCSPQ